MMHSGGHVPKVVLMTWLRGLSPSQSCMAVTLDLLEAMQKQSTGKHSYDDLSLSFI